MNICITWLNITITQIRHITNLIISPNIHRIIYITTILPYLSSQRTSIRIPTSNPVLIISTILDSINTRITITIRSLNSNSLINPNTITRIINFSNNRRSPIKFSIQRNCLSTPFHINSSNLIIFSTFCIKPNKFII